MQSKKKNRPCRYTKAVVICHGKSEWYITRYIYTNLHLPIELYAKDNGAHSIQITSLPKLLSSSPFKSLQNFLDKYFIQTSGSGKKQQLVDFILFIIMDTDDCTDQQKKDYISGQMFSKHWLAPYIVPIYNIPKLESVFEKAGLIHKIKGSEKGSFYKKVFPVNEGKCTAGTVNDIKDFGKKLEGRKDSNFYDMVNYFLNLVESNN